MDVLKKVPVREQDAKVRATNFEEVCYGYNEEEARLESERCINCKNAKCIEGCPVSINIPAFIHEVKEGNFEAASKVIGESSALPAVCGRVCPQESQCEQRCIRGIKGEAVSIGKLERFVADWARENNIKPDAPKQKNGKKVAVIGSGPAGLTCAGDLAKMGYDVIIFEALHEPGGVLVYGIPEFRLPKSKVVQKEIENVKHLGVKIETNVVIGKSTTIDELIDEEGFEAVFIGSGAGLPKFMGIPGENANGVFSANEYLTRSNLMKAFDDSYDTPIVAGKKVAVVGGGNVAMDAARTALRLGAEVHIVYRRSEEELPARVEEVHHAKEEGIIFNLLTNPTGILSDENGWVKGMKCVEMELGEPDESGRRRPVVKAGSEFEMELDTVIMSLGTSPNPLISSTTEGLEVNKWNCKNEYKEGILVCSDCGAELVESLEEDERSSILTGEEEQIELLKKFLEYNDIMSCVITQLPGELSEYTYELSVSREDEELARRATVVFIRETAAAEKAEETAEGSESSEDDEATEAEEKPSKGAHTFVKAEEKAESFKSSAYALTIVGVIGLIAMILMIVGVIPVAFAANVKIIAYIVLTLMFVVFIVMGVHSMITAKKYNQEASMENSKTAEILEWFAATYKAADIDQKTEGMEGSDELMYFKRTEVMKELILTQYPGLEDSYLEHLIDELYQGIFEA